ncbi:hypothetical protein C6568_01350 [Melaminivora suipulveris]|uniref:DUF3106 domain-containing protein n=1 Tax=Melaminivora suipulveris TaxID=2109913 RepID=A0A2R3Q8Q4_9BURK|nr:DUF3106 domain-containing protein [Melaminivora suipulveris]AVO48054.1 hypothetical protein C6568_01350 [Melaminivora suipulveris]
MTASPPRRSFPLNVPAYALALALLAALAVTGFRAVGWVRLAPSTPMPAQALPENRHRTLSDVRPVERPEVGPAWSELTTPQKLALYPLANRWSVLNEAQKRHWLKLAAGFHALAPDEQERVLARLTDWASLSAQQRSQARLNYAATSVLAPDSKRAKWEAYQALSDEERKNLAARASPRPSGVAPAVASSTRKLARVPAANHAPPLVANPPKIPRPSESHVPQALPVPAHPAPAPAPAPVVVETRPVEMPSAKPSALPPLPQDDSAREQPPISGSDPPLHPPQ